jgi:hypothetical protein
MMNEAQARWTVAIVILIGGLFGLYTTLMVGYFTDTLPRSFSPYFLLSRITPFYLGALTFLEFCWFVRWQSLSTTW